MLTFSGTQCLSWLLLFAPPYYPAFYSEGVLGVDMIGRDGIGAGIQEGGIQEGGKEQQSGTCLYNLR